MKERCLISSCKGLSVARGLCRPHYYMAVGDIERGKIKSWKDLEAKGLSKPLLRPVDKRKRKIFDKQLNG